MWDTCEYKTLAQKRQMREAQREGGRVREHKGPLHDSFQRAASELVMEQRERQYRGQGMKTERQERKGDHKEYICSGQ